MHNAVKVLVFAASAFGMLFIIAKIMGKKQIAQLDFVDYVVGISIGSIAAEMAAETERPVYYYIIAMAVFFLLDLAISFLGRKGPLLKRILKGKPVVIIYEGRLLPQNLKKSGLDINDLLALLREKEFFDITQVAYAIFETDGKLSVMPVGAERPAVTKDLPVPIEPAKLPNYIIIDGEISKSGLSEINKDEEWLFSRLKIKSAKELKKILLASYDDKNDGIAVHFQD